VIFGVQIFDVVLNGQITVIEGLDIFAKVGRGVAHDEIIPFSIRSGVLRVGSDTALFNGKLTIEFVKVCNITMLL
jgi:Malectin domain